MPRRVTWRHGRNGPGSRSACQPQEDSLSLIFSGVGKKYLLNAALRRNVRGAALRAVRVAAWSPWVPTCTRSIDVVDSHCRTMSSALCYAGESAWSPWSTITTCTSWPTLGTAQALATRRANWSTRAPDDHRAVRSVDDRAPQTLSLRAHVCHAAAPRIRPSHSDGSRISPRVGTLPGSAHTRFIAAMPPSFTTARTKAAPSRY